MTSDLENRALQTDRFVLESQALPENIAVLVCINYFISEIV